jgi:uncharacterized membrane protein
MTMQTQPTSKQQPSRSLAISPNGRGLASSGRDTSSSSGGWWRLGLEAAAVALLFRQTLRSRHASRRYLAAVTTAVAGATLADAVGTLRNRAPEPIRLRASVTVNRTPDDVYRFWRDFRNLARFMQHVESVEVSNGNSVWHARGPAGVRLRWEAAIVADKPNERIAWRSLEGAELPNYGHVTFLRAPGDRGTEVHVEMGFDPPLGVVGARIAKMFGGIPEQKLLNDLRRFKQVLETGDVALSDASIHRGPHPARPVKPEQLPLVKGRVRS